MLKARILTAIPLIIVTLIAIVWLPTLWLAGAFALLSIVGAWEWARLAGLSALWSRALYALGMLGLLAVLATFQIAQQDHWRVLGLIWWFGAFLLVLAEGQRSSQPATDHPDFESVGWTGLRLSAGYITLGLAWLGLVAIHAHTEHGAFWLMLLLVMVWGADSGAYFSGRRFGQHKLAPAVSPGKTWEGVAGGMLLGLVLVLIAYAIGQTMGILLPGLAWFIPVALSVMAVSVVGDLTESLVKRHAGVKDSGQWLPGHGGLLDRTDALLAAAPVLAAALSRWG